MYVADMTTYRSLSRNKDFTALWTGEAISQLGSSVSMFAFPLVGYALTGSAVLAGLPMAAFMLGMVAALLPAGVVVDRTDRKKLMLAASGTGVLIYGSVAVAAGLGVLTIAHLIVAALLTGVGAGVFGPAEASAVRSVVTQDDLPTALSQNQARHHIAALVGGPLGAAMYSASKALPFVFDAVTFLVSFVTLSRIRTDLSPVPRPKRRVRADLAEGLRYVWERPYFRTMMAFGALGNLSVNAVFFVAILRLVQEGVHPAAIGVIDMLAGVGGILGALAAPYVIDRLPTGRITLAVAWSWVPLLVPLVFWSSPVLVGAMLMLGILLNPAGNAGSQSYRIAITPPELQGRVGSSMQFVGMSMMPLAPIVGGFLLETYGGPAATVGLLVLVTVTALIPTLSAVVRGIPVPAEWPRLDAPASAPEAAAA
jgi:MFS family permease